MAAAVASNGANVTVISAAMAAAMASFARTGTTAVVRQYGQSSTSTSISSAPHLAQLNETGVVRLNVYGQLEAVNGPGATQQRAHDAD